jgi:UDP-glucose 4-epimerase
MRVLVTGGAGFIGSHVVDALISRGDTVTVLDDLSSGKLENLKAHRGSRAFRFIRGDIRDVKAVEKALAGVDAVVHEAAIVSVPLSIENPELVNSVNVEGTANLLNASLNHGVKRFVYASSCAVYGEQKKLPIKEDAQPNPLSPYAASKLAAEKKCLSSEGKKLKTVCLRYFNVYGPRQSAGEYAGVMVKFIERLRASQPPIIYGDGEQTRDFIHVQDVVGATLLALERESASGEVINIGTGKGTKINKLCELFLKAAGKPDINPVYEAPRAGDIRHSWADISKARKLLGFKPKIQLEKGIEMLWESAGGCTR